MKKFFSAVVALVIFFTANNLASAESSPEWVKNLLEAKNATQMVVVAATSGSKAKVSMHEKDSARNWQQIMKTDAFIGKNGLGKTREGDSKTPVGTFIFNAAFGIYPDPGCAVPYTQVDENIYWSGDGREGKRYNEMVDIRDIPDLNTKDSEHIIDYKPYYYYCLNISYNKEGMAGKGSAIFMHCWNKAKPWTGGCVALPEEKMLFVMKNVRPDCVVVINSFENIKNGGI